MKSRAHNFEYEAGKWHYAGHFADAGALKIRNPQSAIRNRTAFSLIEILTTVALLSFIILGLVAMFNQTRRAFVGSMTQVDVLGSGRMAADLIGRELEQLNSTTISGAVNAVNFQVSVDYYMEQPTDFPPSGNNNWVNNLQQLYFVVRNNQQWTAIGYRLAGSEYGNGIGTLYRFSTNITFADANALSGLTNYFNTSNPLIDSNWSRIIDGVVDFRIRPYKSDGTLYANTFTPNEFINQTYYISGSTSNLEYTIEQFSGDALPAAVEVELGVLEDRSYAKYQALAVGGTGPGSPAWGYLTNHAGQVHLFRQRIPIRNVNPAYP